MPIQVSQGHGQEKMRERKYKLTDDTIMVDGRILHRIEAVRCFADIKAGDKGGYIESEYNLSHEGNCWVYDNDMAYDESRLCGNVQILGRSVVSGNCILTGNDIYDNCVVGDLPKDFDSRFFRVKSTGIDSGVININNSCFDTDEFLRKFNSPFLRTLKH